MSNDVFGMNLLYAIHMLLYHATADSVTFSENERKRTINMTFHNPGYLDQTVEIPADIVAEESRQRMWMGLEVICRGVANRWTRDSVSSGNSNVIDSFVDNKHKLTRKKS